MKPQESSQVDVSPPQEAEQESLDQINLDDVAIGRSVEIKTEHTTYVIEKREDGYYISGHHKYCPHPIKINPGMRVIRIGEVLSWYLLQPMPGEENNPHSAKNVRTSLIKSIREK